MTFHCREGNYKCKSSVTFPTFQFSLKPRLIPNQDRRSLTRSRPGGVGGGGSEPPGGCGWKPVRRRLGGDDTLQHEWVLTTQVEQRCLRGAERLLQSPFDDPVQVFEGLVLGVKFLALQFARDGFGQSGDDVFCYGRLAFLPRVLYLKGNSPGRSDTCARLKVIKQQRLEDQLITCIYKSNIKV